MGSTKQVSTNLEFNVIASVSKVTKLIHRKINDYHYYHHHHHHHHHHSSISLS